MGGGEGEGDWWSISVSTPAPNLDFAIRFSAEISLPRLGEYTFTLKASGGWLGLERIFPRAVVPGSHPKPHSSFTPHLTPPRRLAAVHRR